MGELAANSSAQSLHSVVFVDPGGVFSPFSINPLYAAQVKATLESVHATDWGWAREVLVGSIGDDVDVCRVLKSLWCGVAGREREKRAVMARDSPDFIHETDERKNTLSVSVDDDSRDVLQKVVRRHRVKKIVCKGQWLTHKISLHQVHIRGV